MGTTLVNVGILNGRSTKLDSDDLYALAELVENFSTDVVVTTPEIVLPSDNESVATDNSGDSSAAIGEGNRVAEVITSLPASPTVDAPGESKQLPTKSDGGSARADTPHKTVVQPKLNAVSKTEESAARSAKIQLNDTGADSESSPSNKSITVTIEPQPKTAIEKAKQAVIEAAMLAASDSAALSRTKLLAAPSQKPTDQSVIEQKTVGQESVKDEHIEGDQQSKPSDVVAKSIATNNERLKRDNFVVEEISSRLAKELESDLAQTNADHAVSQQSIAIVPPNEKQYERLIENLLEKTVPGLPSAMLITGCETNQRVGIAAMNIAALLAERNLGKILLIDGDIVDKNLTDSLIDSDAPGLTEVLNRQQGVMSAIMQTELQNLFFLPAGIASLSRQKTLNSRLASFNEELKKEFRFVLIDGGVAKEMMPKTWSAFCDSTYLVVSLGDTLNTAASSAVADLQTAGARLLGCVVTNQP